MKNNLLLMVSLPEGGKRVWSVDRVLVSTTENKI